MCAVLSKTYAASEDRNARAAKKLRLQSPRTPRHNNSHATGLDSSAHTSTQTAMHVHTYVKYEPSGKSTAKAGRLYFFSIHSSAYQ